MTTNAESAQANVDLVAMRDNAKEATALLKALANENRLMILCYLEGKELSVSQLNESLDLSQSALSQHLAVLRRDNLVKTRRESQTIYYSLNGDQASTIISTLHQMYCVA
ncbi:DNA-binding transcriptional regulator, ArsR family [Oceanospirillum multiglobuliferum]|uniref:Transcriptional regulator n=2 Tax=Oceanospirillum multiglobuliferum TaxID=64969 RepID=A0A1T4PUB4_9GAMM|nr:transcriptional regulator [Oceanospirillum multiglobuliferum]SJZ95130.1 DNA-binding transcriptional regulator, ArsR family [Oceanospirillum multiglobuliferum]